MRKELPEAALCLHGAIVMFAAFVSGGMIGVVAVGQVEGSIDGWKLAHMEPLINAMVLFAIAGCISTLVLTRRQVKLIVYCLVAMAYSNTVFGYMRALTGAMGYQFDDSVANNIATFAGMLGVPLAMIAFALILLGAVRAAGVAKSDVT